MFKLLRLTVAFHAVLTITALRCQGWLPDGHGPYDTDWWQAYKMPHDDARAKNATPYTAAYWDAATVDSDAPMRWIDPYPSDNEGAVMWTARLLPYAQNASDTTTTPTTGFVTPVQHFAKYCRSLFYN